jgi:hypothetical protein
MHIRLATAAAVAGIAVAALPGHAATAHKPQITDPVGDANALNDQGVGAPIPSASTGPADDAAADISSVTFASTFRVKKVKGKTVKVPTGFTATMKLGAAPVPETFYRITAAIPSCTDLFIEYGTDVAEGGTNMRCPALPGATGTDYKLPDAIVKDSSIIWTIPVSALPAGTTLSTLHAETRFNPAVVTAPAIDEASSTATFTVGK